MGAWTGFIWLRIGPGGGVLQTRNGTFGFHIMWGISRLSEDLLASQEGLCSMEVVSTNSFCSLALSGVNRRRVHTMIREDKRARIFRKIKISQKVFIYRFLKAGAYRIMNVWNHWFGWEENLSARMSQTPTAPPSTIDGILLNYTRYALGYTKLKLMIFHKHTLFQLITTILITLTITSSGDHVNK